MQSATKPVSLIGTATTTAAATALALTLVSAAASAANPKFDEARALQAVNTIVAEHRLYATCMSLDKVSLSIVEENWRREVKQATEAFKDLNPPPTFWPQFNAAVSFDKLLDRNATLGSTMALCHKNDKAVAQFQSFGFSHLRSAAEPAHSLAR